MQVFMRNVAFAADEHDLKVALASVLHKPPFPDRPTNFHVELFTKARSRTHKGNGLLTLPTVEVGETFLASYPFGLTVKNRLIKFSPSNRPPNEALIQAVQSSPWIDPQSIIEERKRITDVSSTIPLESFAFGRFCRDGVFSAEIFGEGTVACEVEHRRIRIQRTFQRTSAGGTFEEFIAGFSQASFFQQLFTRLVSVIYPSNRIIAMASGDLNIFLESDLPPIFNSVMDVGLRGLDLFDDPIPERISSLEDGKTMPPVSQGMCLTFRSRVELQRFLKRSEELHLPRLRQPPSVEKRQIYTTEKANQLAVFLKSLDFKLAFEIEKAVSGGVLDPNDIQELRDVIQELQRNHEPHCAPIFRYFAANLPYPGLNYVPNTPRRKRRSRNRHATAPAAQDLPGRLREAATTYIAELYRPKSRYAPSTATYQSYYLILTPCAQVLEGPLPDQSNSVLRRFGNHECFLRVSFHDENRSYLRRDASLSINKLLESRYKKPLIDGLHLAGHDYQFLGYSMSGLREYSFLFVRPFIHNGLFMDADTIRDQLGDFSKVHHRPALLGARWSQAFSTSDPSVILKNDEIRRIPDRKSDEGSVFTDGCSTISPELSRQVWRNIPAGSKETSRTAPSCFQFRLGGSKGVLFQDPMLSGNVVCIRPSQTKFDSASDLSLNIAATSSRPKLVYLNRPLIVLLEHHGVPESVFIHLQNNAIDDVQSMNDSLRQASKEFSQYGLGASFRLPSLFKNIAGILRLEIGNNSRPGVLRHELIRTVLAYATTHVLREIKHRAHILVPGSYTLIGVSDEWDCLEEGEVYATVVDERTNINLPIEGRVLITRSPQIHPGDVQFVEAVRPSQLKHLKNVVVFSCKGSRSLPSMLGGGDLDGDIYNLILDENLFPPSGRTTVPDPYTPIPHKTTPAPCTVNDVADFVIDYIKSDLLGYISILHLRIADLNGPDCEECHLLAEKASHAVDFPKVGVPVDFKKLPHPPSALKPDFLSGEGINPAAVGSSFYPSKKVLGKLYRNVPIEDYHRSGPKDIHPTDADKIEVALNRVAGPAHLGLPPLISLHDEGLMEEMRHVLDEYSDQLLLIAKTHTISRRTDAFLTEGELVSGTIQERYADHRKRREAATAMNFQTQELTRAIRHEFLPEDNIEHESDDESIHEEDEYSNEKLPEQFKRAWAAWMVAEEAIREEPGAYGLQSFGLIALGVLLEVVKESLEESF